jgi:polyhydroxybutyrate depolymerase
MIMLIILTNFAAMKNSLIITKLVFIFILFSKLTFAQQVINGSIIHDGIERTYFLYVPNTYNADQAAPLLFNFHGYGSTALEQMVYGDFRPIADTAGFLIIHPQGTADYLGNNHWNVGWGGSTVDDVGFTDALIDSIATDYNIDETRIYSTGMSNGGFMSYLLACELSDRFAAMASVTGSMTSGQTESCNAQHATPIMEIHGTGDDIVPYNGTSLFTSIPEVINHWVVFNDCNESPTIIEMPDLDPNDGSTVTQYIYSQGNSGVEVVHFKVINGTHTWPGSNYDVGGTNYDIHASAEIWKFLSKFDSNGLINTTFVENNFTPNSSVKIHPNPVSSQILLERMNNQDEKYQIFSQSGVEVLNGTLPSNQYSIDIKTLPNGFYILKIGQQRIPVIKMN